MKEPSTNRKVIVMAFNPSVMGCDVMKIRRKEERKRREGKERRAQGGGRAPGKGDATETRVERTGCSKWLWSMMYQSVL